MQAPDRPVTAGARLRDAVIAARGPLPRHNGCRAATTGRTARRRPLPAAAVAATLSLAGAPAAAGSLPDEPAGAAGRAASVAACPGQPPGYMALPGTQTCLKIDGLVYYEFWLYGSNAASGQPGWYSADQNGISSYVRGDVRLHSVSDTEYGPLTSFIELRMSLQSQLVPSVMTDTWQLYHGLLNWNGITAGRTQSMFDYFTGSTYASLYEPAWSDTKTNLLAYTYTFGASGFSLTGSMEDSSYRDLGIINAPGFAAGTATGYAGQQLPDFVGALAYTAGWGSAQVSAASHLVNTFLGTGGTGDYAAKTGWATAGGVTLNLPHLGTGDSLTLQGAYGVGALNYIATNPIDNSTLPGGADAVIATGAAGGRQLQLSRAWSVSGGLTHNWSPQWQSNINVSYLDVGQLGPADNFSNVDIQASHIFFPVNNLQFGVEVEYKRIQPQTGALGNALVGLLHIERDF